MYIGQSLNCYDRLKTHNNDGKKDYWNLAVAFITKDNSFTPTHLSYLEKMAIAKANEANRFSVENAVQPKGFEPSESMEAECQDHFDAITLLLGTLGLPVFKQLSKIAHTEENLDQVFVLNARGSNARGMMTDEGFVILAGSTGPVSTTTSFDEGKLALRQSSSNEALLRWKRISPFHRRPSHGPPSGAANLVAGRSSNGWTEWKNDRGVTIDQVYRGDNS